MKKIYPSPSGVISSPNIYRKKHFFGLLKCSLISGTGTVEFTPDSIVFVTLAGVIVLAAAFCLFSYLTEKVLRKLLGLLKTTDEPNPSGYHPPYRSASNSAPRERADTRRLSIATQEGLVFCALKDIVRIEASGSYSCLHLVDGQKQIVSRTLSTLESRLQDCPGFVRVHKSHLIQISYVIKYQKGDGGTIMLTDGTHIPVSRKAKEELLRRLNAEAC